MVRHLGVVCLMEVYRNRNVHFPLAIPTVEDFYVCSFVAIVNKVFIAPRQGTHFLRLWWTTSSKKQTKFISSNKVIGT